MTLWWARKDWLTILTIVFAVGVIVAFWFIAHGAALRFYILFVGVMSALYSLFDICGELPLLCVGPSPGSAHSRAWLIRLQMTSSSAKVCLRMRQPRNQPQADANIRLRTNSERIRRVSLCKTLRWIVSVLGSHLGYHLFRTRCMRYHRESSCSTQRFSSKGARAQKRSVSLHQGRPRRLQGFL